MTAVASPIAFWHDAVTAQAVVDLATSVGLDRALAQGGTIDELSRRIAVDAHHLSVVLDALESLGATECDEVGGWHATPFFDNLGALRQGFAPQLDRAVAVGVEVAETAATFYPEVVARLGEWHRRSAARVAQLVGRPGARVLDAGAGSAVWSLAIVNEFPDVSVLAVDLPGVVPTTEAIVDASGCRPSYTFLGADLFTDDLNPLGSFDIVLAGNICHLFAADRVSELVGRLAQRVAPGGVLAIVDAIPTGALDAADRAARLYGVHLLGRSGEGRPWPLASYERWLRAAGLDDITHVCVAEDSPMSLLTGTMISSR